MTEPQPPYPTDPPPYGAPPPAPQQPAAPNPYAPGPYPQQPYPQQPYPQQPYPQQPPYGVPPSPYGYGAPPPSPPTDGLALASMIVGIVSLVLACGYGIGLLGSPAALIMGRIASKRIDRADGAVGGKGFAQAGFILGIVGTVLLVIAIAIVVIVVVAAVNGSLDSFETTYSS